MQKTYDELQGSREGTENWLMLGSISISFLLKWLLESCVFSENTSNKKSSKNNNNPKDSNNKLSPKAQSYIAVIGVMTVVTAVGKGSYLAINLTNIGAKNVFKPTVISLFKGGVAGFVTSAIGCALTDACEIYRACRYGSAGEN